MGCWACFGHISSGTCQVLSCDWRGFSILSAARVESSSINMTGFQASIIIHYPYIHPSTIHISTVELVHFPGVGHPGVGGVFHPQIPSGQLRKRRRHPGCCSVHLGARPSECTVKDFSGKVTLFVIMDMNLLNWLVVTGTCFFFSIFP